MRRAELIVARLLSENEPAGTGELPREAPRGSVYVIQNDQGRKYPDLNVYQQEVGDIDAEIQRGTIIIVAHDEDNITVYSKAIPVPVSTDTLLSMMDDLNILIAANTGWARSLGVRPAPSDWHQVFASQKYMDRVKRESERMRKEVGRDQKKEQKPVKGSQVKSVLGPAAQPVPPPERRHKLDLGFLMAQPEGQHGVQVMRIIPDTAAARSGLEKGDIIRQVGPFQMLNGRISPVYKIDTHEELQRVLGWLAPGTNFKMNVLRGDQWQDVVLTPTVSDWPEES